jgi:hypothetical protein
MVAQIIVLVHLEAVILVANSVFEMVAKYSGGKTPSLDVS